MSDFKECSRRGRIVSTNVCECFSNRIIHPKEGYATIDTCQACPYRNIEDDPELPHYSEQKHPNSQQELPSKGGMAVNFIKAVGRHIQDGARKVSKEELEERLKQCDKCVFHKNNRCTHMKCGCFLTKKARLKSENCPIGRWPKQE